MAKVNEKKTARFMFVEQGKDGKEIAALLGVSENTISKWVNSGGWKEERSARLNDFDNGVKNIKQVLENLSEQTLQLQQARKKAIENDDKAEVAGLDVQAVAISQQVAMYNKTLASFQKENRITLAVYLDVMDDIFDHLRGYDAKLHLSLVDFLEQHTQFISKKLG